MTKSSAYGLLWAQVCMLLIGTQIPGSWRADLEVSLHAPVGVSSWAHFLLFAGMAFVASWRPLAWPWRQVVLASVGLAMLTEALQFLALDRHPRWIDVGIDMCGAVTGLALSLMCVKLLPVQQDKA